MEEGGLDTALLGACARDLLEVQAGLAARYAKSLDAAARAGRNVPANIAAIVSTLLEFQSTKPTHHTVDRLELLVELTLHSGQQLYAAGMAAGARVQLGGRGKAAQLAGAGAGI